MEGNVHSKRSHSRYDEMETEEVGQQEGQPTCDYILKKYAKLFKGIGRFQCTPVKIQLSLMQYQYKSLPDESQ